jgi:hypothetical protein
MRAVDPSKERLHEPSSPWGKEAGPALIALWAVFTAVLSAWYLRLPPSPDHVTYDYIGWMLSEGAVLYRDVADGNWPGQMFIHALSVGLFGNEIWAYRAFELVVILPAGCAILFSFLRRYGDRVAAWAVVPVYQVMYATAGLWISGQREIVAAPLLVAAAYCLLRRMEGAGRTHLVLQGLCLAGAGLIRPTLLVMAPLLALADLLLLRKTGRGLRRIFEDHIAVALSTLAPLALIAAISAPTGALRGWYEATVAFNLEVYSQSTTPRQIAERLLPWILRCWQWYLVVALLGAVSYWRRDLRALAAVGMILPATIASVLVQGKGFEYHLGALYPLLAILVATALGASWRLLTGESRRPLRTATALFLIAGSAAGLARNMWGVLAPQRELYLGRITAQEMYRRYEGGAVGLTVEDLLELSDYVERTTAPDSTVLFWGRPSHVNYWAKRHSPSFAAGFALLSEPGQDFSLFARWRARLEETMTSRPPALLLLVKEEESGGYQGLPPPERRDEKLAGVILRHLPDYRLEKSIGVVDVYRLARTLGESCARSGTGRP